MKKLLRVLGLALLLTLGACGGGSSNPAIGGNSPTNGIGPSKPINSYWTMVDNNYDSSLNGFVFKFIIYKLVQEHGLSYIQQDVRLKLPLMVVNFQVLSAKLSL